MLLLSSHRCIQCQLAATPTISGFGHLGSLAYQQIPFPSMTLDFCSMAHILWTGLYLSRKYNIRRQLHQDYRTGHAHQDTRSQFPQTIILFSETTPTMPMIVACGECFLAKTSSAKYPKNESEPSDPPNSRPLGTSVTIPADAGSRARIKRLLVIADVAKNMKVTRKVESWWVIPLVILLLPLVVAVMLFWALYSISLYIFVWACWWTCGRDLLFVYSDSPHWKKYIEEEILPRIQDRAVVLNWSERRNWIRKMTLGSMLFRHFGGYREFNPIALRFRPFWIHHTYRFWEPIRKWRKKGDRADLDSLLTRFFADLER